MAGPVYVALLRGINVGGARKLPMAALRAELGAAGYQGVATYVQSGNVVLTTPSQAGAPGRAVDHRAADVLAAGIHALIEDRFALDVPVIVRSAEELAAVHAGNPFLGIEGATGTQLHVAFLAGRPSPAQAAAFDPDRSLPDRLAVAGREVFLYCPDGLGRSKVLNGAEKLLGTTMTVRNWNTVTTLVAMCCQGATG